MLLVVFCFLQLYFLAYTIWLSRFNSFMENLLFVYVCVLACTYVPSVGLSLCDMTQQSCIC